MKHYRIRQLDEGGFFIARRTTFRNLQDLVEHYSKDADGLCVNLCKPCVQVSELNFFPEKPPCDQILSEWSLDSLLHVKEFFTIKTITKGPDMPLWLGINFTGDFFGFFLNQYFVYLLCKMSIKKMRVDLKVKKSLEFCSKRTKYQLHDTIIVVCEPDWLFAASFLKIRTQRFDIFILRGILNCYSTV